MNTFKVGDWVSNTKYTNCVFKIKSFDRAISITEYDSANGYYGSELRGAMLKDLKPWTPQPGEYIMTLRLGLCEVIRYIDDSTIEVNPQCLAIWSNQKIKLTSNIEPFIGQLPSWIKE